MQTNRFALLPFFVPRTTTCHGQAKKAVDVKSEPRSHHPRTPVDANPMFSVHSPMQRHLGERPEGRISPEPRLGADPDAGDQAPKGQEARPGWPHCEQIDGDCLLHEAASQLGESAYKAFAEFVNSETEGGRLNLEATTAGFLMTITEAVDRSSPSRPDIRTLQALRSKLDRHAPPQEQGRTETQVEGPPEVPR